MRSPKDMRIIQIEVTNACNKQCSNCTRFCGHHKKPFFMDFDTFKRAVDSLDGYQGIHSIMGGEPTLHPEYERMLQYLASKFPKHANQLIRPQKDFIQKVYQIEVENAQAIRDEQGRIKRIDVVGPGVYSNMGPNYKRYYETITDIAPFQCLDDHLNPVYHQAAFVTRKELGIPDDEWIKLRDNCWMQNEWSASITPKGCFFCEIAAALDMLLDGPGGWPIEPGWWKRTPEEFGDQLHWCELCGFALKPVTRDSAEEIDDVSPEWYERLKALQSPKFKSGRVNVMKIENGEAIGEKCENKFFSAGMPYVEHYEDRFSTSRSTLFSHHFEFAQIKSGNQFGTELNKLLQTTKDWLVLSSTNAVLSDDFVERMNEYVLNPGTLHYIDLSKSNDTAFVKNADTENQGYVAMFNKLALSLREFGFDRIAQTRSIDDIVGMWKKNKVVELSSGIEEYHDDVCDGVRIAVWGTGSAGCAVHDIVERNKGKLVIAVDKSEKRQGCDFYGLTIQKPETLIERVDEFNVLIAANFTRMVEIQQEALALGIPEEKVKFMSYFTECLREKC